MRNLSPPDFLPFPSTTALPTIQTPDDQILAGMIKTLQAAGFKKPVLVRGLGFSVTPCGLLIPFDRVPDIAQDLDRHNTDKHARAYVFPYDRHIASQKAVSDVKVHIPALDPNKPNDAAWISLIHDALNEWNHAGPGSGVRLRFVSEAAQADTQVHVYNRPDGQLGFANIPNYGKVGEALSINAYYSQYYPASIYKNTIVHEMGHALGLAHSGGEDASFEIPDLHIPGTNPAIDPNAVMASAGHAWLGWSADELTAIAYLFPAPVTEEPTPFEDLTTFQAGNWNGWERDANGHNLLTNEDAAGNCYIHSTNNDLLYGSILVKNFKSLVPGNRYSVSARVKRYDLGGRFPEFRFSHNGREFGTPFVIESLEWVTISEPFTAGDTNTLQIVCRFVLEQEGPGFSNIALDDLRVREITPASRSRHGQLLKEATEDLTTFDNDNWNGWTRGPNGGSFRIDEDQTGNFYLHSTSSEGLYGVVLEKSLAPLEPGNLYTFSIKTRLYDRTVRLPMLSLEHNRTPIIAPVVVESEKWITLGQVFTATDQNRLDILCVHIGDPSAPDSSNIALDDLLIRPLLVDFTGFEPNGGNADDQWNGWELNPTNSLGVTLKALAKPGAPQNWVVDYPTYGNVDNSGVILKKTIRVIAGFGYQFSAKVRRTQLQANTGVPVLSLSVNSQAVTHPFSLPRNDTWHLLSAVWHAPLEGGPEFIEFAVVNNTSTGNGNDFVLDDLAILELVPPPSNF